MGEKNETKDRKGGCLACGVFGVGGDGGIHSR